jgi:hypothetical protein
MVGRFEQPRPFRVAGYIENILVRLSPLRYFRITPVLKIKKSGRDILTCMNNSWTKDVG